MDVVFSSCKYLDYKPNYGKCKRQLIYVNNTDKLCWLRPLVTSDQNHALVQFCKLRGRLDNPISCLCKKDAICSEYINFEHKIEVSEGELYR